jgi:hypothetical protein
MSEATDKGVGDQQRRDDEANVTSVAAIGLAPEIAGCTPEEARLGCSLSRDE